MKNSRLYQFLFRPTLYIRVAPRRLQIRDPVAQRDFDQAAVLLIDRNQKEQVLAIGDSALARNKLAGMELVWPFAHPRSLISDFTAAEQLLKRAVQQLRNSAASRFFRPSHVFIHLVPEAEGGYTQVEYRAMHELALGATRGRHVYALSPGMQGYTLTDAELLQPKLLAQRFSDHWP